MSENNLLLIEGFTHKRQNGVIDNFQILISNECIYLINSTTNYSQYLKSIFSGIGDLLGLFGNTLGLIGGLASEITGSKLSKLLKEYSEKSTDKKLEKLKSNLNQIAKKKKGITKIDFTELQNINVKKGYLLNGSSFAIFTSNKIKIKIHAKKREHITNLVDAIKARNRQIEIQTRFL